MCNASGEGHGASMCNPQPWHKGYHISPLFGTCRRMPPKNQCKRPWRSSRRDVEMRTAGAA
eukprot:3891724-Pyramimonas_sp.AAC.1